MRTTVRIAAAQTADVRDDIPAALAAAEVAAAEAEAAGARLLCFPEGYLQGYVVDGPTAGRLAIPLDGPVFADVIARLGRFALTVVLGVIERDGDRLYNTAAVLSGGRLFGRYRKRHLLPGETAFAPGTETPVFDTDSLCFGIAICFDSNFPEAARRVADQGATLLVCCANNMLPEAKAEAFRAVHNAARGERCRETGLWLISSDVTGRRDGRVGWGPTAVLDPTGVVVAQLPLDAPGLLVYDLPVGAGAGAAADH